MKKKNPKVSVVISAYNHEQYVGEAIQSILDQTFQDFEIVITDNGSTDNTFEEIKKIKDPRIRLYRFRDNQGACAAYNNCKERSKGKYILIFNSDDILLPNKIEVQTNFLDQNPEIGAVFTYVQLIDEDGNEYNKKHHYTDIFNQPNRTRYEWLNYLFFNGNCLCASTPMVRKKCFSVIGLNDLRLAQLPDLELWTRLLLNYDIHIIQEKLIKFRIRTENKNVSADTPESRVRSMYEFSQVLANFLTIKNVEEFGKIFPEEAKKHDDITNDELIPFYVARAALSVEHVFHQKFGLDTLFEMLKNKNIVKKLEKVCNFNYVSFIRLTGKHDIYNVNQILNQDEYIRMLEKKVGELEKPGGLIRSLINKHA